MEREFTNLQVDHTLLVAKATDIRLNTITEAIYQRVQQLFGASRNIVGMFTFSDSGEPQAKNALVAAGVELQASFKFNNTSFWDHDGDEACARQFYEMTQ